MPGGNGERQVSPEHRPGGPEPKPFRFASSRRLQDHQDTSGQSPRSPRPSDGNRAARTEAACACETGDVERHAHDERRPHGTRWLPARRGAVGRCRADRSRRASWAAATSFRQVQSIVLATPAPYVVSELHYRQLRRCRKSSITRRPRRAVATGRLAGRRGRGGSGPASRQSCFHGALMGSSSAKVLASVAWSCLEGGQDIHGR